MAIIWVDPYIGSTAGPANGTTDSTTRNGTYAAPLRFTDVFSAASATAPAYNGLAIAAGDEIRFKGLTEAQWKIPITDNWKKTSFSSNRFETTAKSGEIPAAYLGTSPTKLPVFWVDSCPGFGGDPAIFTPQYIHDGGTYYYTDQNSTWWQNYAWGVMGGNDFTVSLINADYQIPILTSNYCYLLNNLPAGVTITAGWTSETVRGGKTHLMLRHDSSSVYLYLGYDSSSYTNASTWDVPEMFFIRKTLGSYNTDIRCHAATGATMNIGGFSWTYGSSQVLSFYLQPNANVTVGMCVSSGYGPQIQTWNSQPANATVTLHNVASGYGTCVSLGVSPSPAMNFKVKNVYSSQSASAIFNGVSSQYINLELLPGGIITAGQSCYSLLSTEITTLTIGTGVTNTFSGAQYSAGVIPKYRTAVTPPAYDGVMTAAVTPTGAFTQVTGVSFSAPELDNIYRGKMLSLPGGDYRTADITLANGTVASGEVYRGLHFATNNFDQRPIAAVFSNAGAGIVIYNEASKADALTWQSAPAAAGELFYKQVAIDLPAYAGMSGLRVDVEYETTADFNGEMHLTPYGINGTSGDQVAEPNYGGSGTRTITDVTLTPTTYSYTIPYSWLNGNAITQLYMKLKYRSGNNTGKFYLRNITVSQVL